LEFIWNFEIGLGIEIENLWNWFGIWGWKEINFQFGFGLQLNWKLYF